MAITAVVTVNPSTAYINQNVVATLTISNSGLSDVNVTGISPLAYFTGTSNPDKVAGGCALGGTQSQQSGANVVVPASGSLVQTFNVVFFAPSTRPVYSGGGGTYDVGATVYTNDGSVTAATVATVTVNPLPLPASEQ